MRFKSRPTAAEFVTRTCLVLAGAVLVKLRVIAIKVAHLIADAYQASVLRRGDVYQQGGA